MALRDLARFGETMRLDGRFNGQTIVPKAFVDDVRRGGDRAKFAPAGYKTLPGGSYRSMWWVFHNPHGAYSARGIHGQAIYIDPTAEMVIALLAILKAGVAYLPLDPQLPQARRDALIAGARVSLVVGPSPPGPLSHPHSHPPGRGGTALPLLEQSFFSLFCSPSPGRV